MTYQRPDSLFFEGKTISLNTYYLDDYLINFTDWSPLYYIDTSLHRGYEASFEIVGDQMLIKDVLSYKENEGFHLLSYVDELFPKSKKAFWVSSMIRIDKYRGYFDEAEPEEGIFEYLKVYKGDYLGKHVMNYQELQLFKREQFEYFLISDDYPPIYNLWKRNNPTITDEAIQKIVLDDIMRYTKQVYV